MELKDLREDEAKLDDQRAPYEPPKATFVPLKLAERLMSCGLYSYCAPNQYYQ